jgi:hypothetical protein
MRIRASNILFFITCVLAYYFYFGFGPPTSPGHPYVYGMGRGASTKLALVFIFSVGAACFGDYEYGLFPRQSLRWLFIIGGILGAIITVVLTLSFRSALAS